MIVITKPGSDHIFQGKNCQDYACAFSNVKLVLDGCGSGRHSEVGAKLFGQLLKEAVKDERMNHKELKNRMKAIFEKLITINKPDDEPVNFIFDNLCFSIAAVIENSFSFEVIYCGDGYLVGIDRSGEVELIDLNEGHEDAPPYFAYNYIKPEYLNGYRDGVKLKRKTFLKSKYKNIGAATVGIRFMYDLNLSDKNKFKEAIFLGQQGKIGQIINRNPSVFKDDISICM